MRFVASYPVSPIKDNTQAHFCAYERDDKTLVQVLMLDPECGWKSDDFDVCELNEVYPSEITGIVERLRRENGLI